MSNGHAHQIAVAAIAISLLCLQLPAHAAGWVAALKNTAAEDFDAEDLQIFLSAAQRQLDFAPPGTDSTWRNPSTGASGTFRELSRNRDARGRECKRIRFTVSTKRTSGQGATWTACREPGGRWRLAAAR